MTLGVVLVASPVVPCVWPVAIRVVRDSHWQSVIPRGGVMAPQAM